MNCSFNRTNIKNLFQNEGEINSFEVHKLDNDNNKAVNVWALPAPTTQDWAIGRVEVSSDGDKTYQVIYCIHTINKKLF